MFATSLIDADATGKVLSHDLKYELQFAATGVRLPSSLTIGGSPELLLGGGCPRESGIGFGVFPAITASGLNGSPGSSDLTVVMSGPAIARVRVAWSTPYPCQGAQIASGSTTFTLFPSGRIVRTDAAIMPSTTHLGVTPKGEQCGCSSDSPGFDVETFWAFRAGTDVDESGAPSPPAGAPAGCTLYPADGVGIGVGWGDTATRMPGQSIYVKDLVAQQATLDPAPSSWTSAIQLANTATSCSDILAGLVDPDILVGGAHVQSDETGIFRADGALTAAFTLTTTNYVPPGWAVSLDLDPHAVLTSSRSTGTAWYAAQIDPADGHTLLYFRDPLDVGDTITIEPK